MFVQYFLFVSLTIIITITDGPYVNGIEFDISLPATMVINETQIPVRGQNVTIYECIVGGKPSDEDDFQDCFPEPASRDCPVSRNYDAAVRLCEAFAANYVAYFKDNILVHCDQDIHRENIADVLD